MFCGGLFFYIQGRKNNSVFLHVTGERSKIWWN